MLRRLVPAMLAVAVLAGCGGDDGDDDPSGATDGTSSSVQTRPGPDDGAGKPPGDIEGTGYSFDAPPGWADRSDQADELAEDGGQPDVLIFEEGEGDSSANINVLRETGLPEGTDAAEIAGNIVDGLRDPLTDEEVELGATDISEIRALELDGEPARSFDYSSEQEGVDLRFRQVVAVRDGVGYLLTYTAAADRFDDGVAAVDDVVASWAWE